MASNTRWLVDYNTESWEKMGIKHAGIVIHCENRADVRDILKRHLHGEKFKINRIMDIDKLGVKKDDLPQA